MLMLGLKPVDPLFPIALAHARSLRLDTRLRFADWLGTPWETRIRDRFLAGQHAATAVATTSDSIPFLPAPPQPLAKAAHDTTGAGPGILGGSLGNYADVGMMIRGHGELGGAWNRYSPCDPGLQLTCNNSLIPQLRPDVQFGVIVGGTISDRIHINVDYDQTREFDAANNINVYYQGFEDEIVQKLEMGDVSIRLPSSRYITQGIPAGNFGFKATGQLGPIDFQTVFAQQRGDVTTREFRLGGGGATSGLVQDETLSIDDGDYVKGQFFFLTDPDSIAGTPHIDVLTLRAGDASPRARPAAGAVIEVYRDERPSATNQQQQGQLGYFLADGLLPDGSRAHSGLFRRLQQGKDYVLHPSGLWIMLRAPLRADEALAVSFVTEAGDTVGTPSAESVPAGQIPPLRLLRAPLSKHQPNFPTWTYELHNVYRVHSSSTVDLSSIQLTISLGQMSAGRTFANTIVGQVPYLKLFGLDEDAPANALDAAQVFQPGQVLGGESTTSASIAGTYVMLPTLRPFYEPAPVTSAGLSADNARLALGNDANGAIYNDVDPVTREAAGRYRMNFEYRVRVEGLVSSFNLGAFGLREGSDKILIGDKTLARGTDYNIDYDIGMVTLLDPQSLFATNPGAEIRATWEQKSQFQIAPTSVFGMNARYQLGTRGELNFLGLYQAEKTIMTRPQLGMEPGSIFLGGTSGHFDLGGRFLDRVLSRLPGLRMAGTSSVALNAEAAFSLPNPNRRNEAYIEDFEGADATTLSPLRRNWLLGSRPQDLSGTQGFLPDALLPANAAQLVWQHDLLGENGQPVGTVLASAIDKQIRVVGTETPEPVMWLTLGDTARPMSGKRWRAMTTVLSTTGNDLSRSEYLEFYAKATEGSGKAIIFDIGTVSEDAFYLDATGATNGTYPDATPWGLGILDAEARLALREIWGTEQDARGLWNQSCTGTGASPGAWGDPSVNCARKNGYLDTEDLDGNGLLDELDGTYFRYVVPIETLSPYLVRDKTQTGTGFQLYRIPLREGTPLGGATTASWRFVKHLRMTLTSSSSQRVDQMVIARLRIVGSRWVKRDLDGVNRGLLSDEKGLSAGSATVEAGPVGSLTDGADYSSPPAVLNQLQDPTQGIGGSAVEVNEKGLRIRYTRVGADERAEIYYRYAQQPRSFLNYRNMRLWAVAKRGNFGPAGDQRLLIKVGTDPRNYYLYQAKLNPAVGDRGVLSADWQPEITIDFEQWFALKARAEVALLRHELPTPAGNEPYVLYSADSTYAIVFEDRSRAPNLAAVRELAFAVYNGSSHDETGDVWLNDVRLGSAFRDGGMAGTVSMDLRGGDFISSNITYSNQGSLFRQLNQDANYLGAGDLAINTTAQLGQILPAGWGLDMPMTFSHARSTKDPTLLESSDVQAAQLPGLRATGSSLTRVGLSIRKRTPSSNPFVSAIVDGLSLRLGYNAGNSSAITLHNEASGLDGSLNYGRDIKSLDVDVVPGFIEAALRLLAPAAIEKSGFFQRLTGARLRYTPARLTFATTYFGQERRAFQYNTILMSDSDAIITPIESPRRTLETNATLAFAPFASLSSDITLRSSRDLLPSERASKRAVERNAIEDVHRRLAGIDVGWETNRSLTSQLNFHPTIAEWIRPVVTFNARFGTDRSPSYLELVTVGADTTAILQRRFQADRQLRRQLELQPFALYRALLADTTGWVGGIGRVIKTMQPVNLSWSSSLGSQFDRNSNTPGFAYQLALGDLHSFRVIGADSAAAASETGRFEAASSLRLPNGAASLDVQFASSDLLAFDQRGGSRTENEKTWPNLRLNWSDVPLPPFLRAAIPNLALTGSFQQKRRTQALGLLATSDRGSRETSVPISARLTLAKGFAVSYAGTWSQGESDDPTGDAEQGGMNHNFNVTASVKPPASLKETLRQPLRASLVLTQNAQHQCRFRSALSGQETELSCVPFIDFRNRGVNFTLDTVLSDLNVGVQLGYNSRQDLVGTRRGNSQFNLAIFANFELPVGQVPTGGMGGVR